jgi:hypothetical protein
MYNYNQITGYVSFIAAPNTAALSYGKPESAGTSHYSCGYQDRDKRNVLSKSKIKYVHHQSGDTKSVGSTNSVSLFEFALYILCKANTRLNWNINWMYNTRLTSFVEKTTSGCFIFKEIICICTHTERVWELLDFANDMQSLFRKSNTPQRRYLIGSTENKGTFKRTNK